MARARRARHLRLVPPETRWLGARVATSLEFIEDDELLGADLVIWYEPATEHIHSMELVPIDAPASQLGAALAKAMRRANAEGLPKPTRFVVADHAHVEVLRAVLGPKAVIETGAISQLESIAAQFCEDYERDHPSPRHADSGAGDDQLRAYVVSANALYAAAPWATFDDDQLIAFEAPELGITSGRAAIIGALGESFGYVVYRSAEAYDAWYQVAVTKDMRAAPPTLSMNFESAAQVPRRMRDEAIEWGWLFARRDVFPLILRMGRHLNEEPVTAEDVALITALNCALADFTPSDAKTPASGRKGYERPGLPRLVLEAVAGGASLAPATAAIERLFERYVSYVESRPMDEPSREQTLSAAALLCGFLDDLGVPPDELTATLCSEFMLEFVPGSIHGSMDLLQRLPAGLVAFLQWLHEEKVISRASSAIKRIQRETPRYLVLLGRRHAAR